MTIAQQRRFYFPLWNAAANHHGWYAVKGRLVAQNPNPGTAGLQTGSATEVDQLISQIWQHAETLAQQAHRAITADDLRHACHIVALGKDKSSADITSKELDRLADLFRLLAQPDSIDLMRAWLEPEIGERKRLVGSITRHAKAIAGDFKYEAYINEIAESRFAGKYQPPFWEDLDLRLLRHLAITLSERARGHAQQRQPQPANPY